MSEKSKSMLRGSARALTGVAIIGVSVATAALLGSGVVGIPSFERQAVAVTADASQNATYALVCTGSFAELGSDPSRPTAAIPGGSSTVLLTGESLEERVLARETEGGTAPSVIESSADGNLAAAELQQVTTTALQGLSASSCAEPVHEQWLVGGGTTLGQSTTLVLGNPFAVPSTVQVSIFDENGKVDSSRTTGVLVPAGSQRIVSLNGYAPGRESLVVRVESTGAAVTAALGVSQTIDIRSFAVDTATRQLSPEPMLVIPGVANMVTEEKVSDGAAPDTDLNPIQVRLLSPEGSGTAVISAHDPEGSSTELGTVELKAGVVSDFKVKQWPANAQAIVVEADVPVVGGARGSADVPPAHDYAWFSPAPELPSNSKFGASVVLGGELVLTNPGTEEVTVTVATEGATAPEQTINLPAGAAIPVSGKGQLWLTSTGPVYAGVRILSGPNIAGYPVLAPMERSLALTVFTR
ncbi:DUF5719 family protein [Leucobacter sp. UT-8R-CII-1-4]|uniref:DUF5719 family protein n=1 Tax=Leucobacter sp. UT-8R-CII-1-4 TaxID=3040075 RepID=UPI0024A7D57A|nr:DUF5719 family protein [Leucobacter sp. UT-8R-CII-1-4]MDI6023777.1 DUF5719 family protein [Leucobacter sp. UT-8R-CII-1-4]